MFINGYLIDLASSLDRPEYVRTWLFNWGVILFLSTTCFGQSGPYLYGRADPVTHLPTPPSPTSDYYTLGINQGLVKFMDPQADVINTGDHPDFLNELLLALPEHKNRSNDLGYGLAADVMVVNENLPVYVVFAKESASNRSALGYFLYTGEESPANLAMPNPLFPGKSYLDTRRIIFANASSNNSGGQMTAGDRVKLLGDKADGTFSKGVRIAWFVVSDGWNGQQVGNGKNVLYSNPLLNPGGRKQAAALDYISSQARTILTFEDLPRTEGGGSDHDFNDLTFYITNVSGAKPTFFPNCAGQFVLTQEEYDKLPKDGTGKLICSLPAKPLTNLSLTAVCANEAANQLKWKITNPNSDAIPFHWIITDGTTSTIQLQSAELLVAPPGDSYIFSNPASGKNYMTLLIENTVQPNASRVPANTAPCQSSVPVPPVAIDTLPANTCPPPVTDAQDLVKFCKETDGVALLDGGPGTKYQWLASGHTSRREEVSEAGIYYVRVFNEHDCFTLDSVRVIDACKPRLFLPRAFEPNGDGINDTFDIFGSYFKDFEMTVFNRWGEIIFFTRDRDKPWDGYYRGAPMPVGVYAWTISYRAEFKEHDQGIQRLKGWVEIVP